MRKNNEYLLLRTGVQTVAHRIYPKSVVEEAINDEFFQYRLKHGRITGQIGFPPRLATNVYLESHVLKDVYFKGDDLYGEIEILNNKNGDKLRELITSGSDVTFGLRSAGEVDMNKKGIHVISLLEINSFDLVNKSSKKE